MRKKIEIGEIGGKVGSKEVLPVSKQLAIKKYHREMRPEGKFKRPGPGRKPFNVGVNETIAKMKRIPRL